MMSNTTIKVSPKKDRRQGATKARSVASKHLRAGSNLMPPSQWEALFLFQCRAFKVPAPVREYRFNFPERQWRFDFAWPIIMLAVEIDGAVHRQGRHTRGAGFEADIVKLNEALLLGWAVLRFSGGQVKSGYAIDTLQRFFQRLKNQEA